MAIGGIDQQYQAMVQQQRQFSVGPPIEMATGRIPAGSLIIADTFVPAQPNDKLSHGEMVNLAARRDGFKGPVFTQSVSTPNAFERAKTSMAVEDGFFAQNPTPEQTRANIAKYAANDALGLLEGQTRMVEGATASGAKNSVLNLSSGGSVASLTGRLFGEVSVAWAKDTKPEVRELAQRMSGNFAAAYGLSNEKLLSEDPKVSGPERAKLQEALMNGISTRLANNPDVAKANRNFTTAVGRFEASGRNSVVIAAGNEGDYLDQMADLSHGQKAQKVPADFNTNFLSTPEATMVGATRWYDNGNGATERIAGYSNVNAGVDIFASGSLSTQGNSAPESFGTSFASPRVAAAVYRSALQAGGTPLMEPGEHFGEERGAGVTDPFGNGWYFGRHKR